jgi:hypothetical protein
MSILLNVPYFSLPLIVAYKLINERPLQARSYAPVSLFVLYIFCLLSALIVNYLINVYI